MLNKLSGLSSPPLPFAPLTILSTGDLAEDLEVLRVAAPNAVVRGGARSPWTLPNQNRVLVFDRCGRMVYQQTLQQSNTNLQSVEAALLSAHLDDPCGPCHLPHQEEPSLTSHGGSDRVQEKSTSQAKMSSIANAYAWSNVANPTDNRLEASSTDHSNEARHTNIDTSVPHSAVEETTDGRKEDAEGIRSETTRKPERKKKKNKRKKGKHEKPKKRKHVDEEVTSTSKPTETVSKECDCGTHDPTAREGCGCAGQDLATQQTYEERLEVLPSVRHTTDDDENLVSLNEIVNEILESRAIGHGAAHTTDATTTILPRSRVVWPMDKRDFGHNKNRNKKQKNGKENRMDLQQEMNEGIEIVKEEEELVEYPDAIDAFLETEDNALAEIEKIDEGRLLVRKEGYPVNQGAENGLSREDGGMGFGTGNERDEEGLIADVLTDELGDDQVVVPNETYSREREEDDAQSRRELMANDKVWGTYRQDESKDRGEKKQQGMFKDASKKGNKKDGKNKRVEEEEIDKEEVNVDDWVGSESDEIDSQEYVLHWPGEQDEAMVEQREIETRVDASRRAAAREFATWKEVTVAPTVHDSRSSGDSEDQTRRVVVYESDGESQSTDDLVGEKVALLHSKAQPWAKGKH